MNLRKLNITYTEFPLEICKLTTLKALGFCKNKKQKIPSEICNLIALNYLKLNRTNLEEWIPAEIGNMLSLKKIDLRASPKRDFAQLKKVKGNNAADRSKKKDPCITFKAC